jgi:hypothetical protein
MTARQLLTLNAILRTAYGAASLFAPKLIFRTASPVPDERYFNALFGGRDLSIAAATAVALREGREREAWMLNASCEVTDTIALAQEIRDRGEADAMVKAALAFSAVGWTISVLAHRARR